MNLELENEFANKVDALCQSYSDKLSAASIIGILETLKFDILMSMEGSEDTLETDTECVGGVN